MLVETIEGIVLLCIASIGIIGNIIAIPYFASRIHRQKTFYQLLTCLSICDLIVVTNGTLLYGLPKVSNSYGSGTYFIIAPFVFPLFEMGSTGGIYATMAICIERYFVVCRPLWYRAQATPSRTYTIPILLFSIIYNIPRFFEIKTIYIPQDPHPNNAKIANISCISNHTQDCNNSESELDGQEVHQTFQYSFEATKLRQNVNYYGVYHVGCAIIFQFILPLLVLIILNILIVRELIKHNNGPAAMMSNGDGLQRTMSIHQGPSQLRRRRNQVDRAKVTLAICGIFLVCHMFKWVLNFYEFYRRIIGILHNLTEAETESAIYESGWFIVVINISNTLVVLNSSLNFYIYVLKDLWTKITQRNTSDSNCNTNGQPNRTSATWAISGTSMQPTAQNHYN